VKAVAGSIDLDMLKAALSPSTGCVSIEQLSRLCDRDHAGSQDARAAEHVAGCPRCRTELALLKQFESAELDSDEEADAGWIAARLERDVARLAAGEELPRRRWESAPPWSRRLNLRPLVGLNLRPLVGGLGVAAALLLVVLNVPLRERVAPEVPNDVTATPSVFRSDALGVKGPTGDLETAPKELRWDVSGGAASYAVTVMEVDRTEVWSGQSREAKVALPASVRARMVPGKPFLWQVVAKDAAGNALATSEVQRFRVRLHRPEPRE
jgi:hypothetical protein